MQPDRSCKSFKDAHLLVTRKSSKIQLFYEYVLTQFRSITALESGRTKQWGGVLLDHRLRLRTYSQPAPSHCPHGFSSRLPVARQAGQASQSALFAPLPMTPVQRLPAVTCALAIDHLERVRQRSAARTNGHRLRLLVRSLFRFGFRCLVGHGCVQPTPNLFILETARLWVKRVASNPFYFSHSGRAAKRPRRKALVL